MEVNTTVDLIRSNGGEATACIDQASLSAVLENLSRLDIVISASPAVPNSHHVGDTSEDTWRGVVVSTLDSTFRVIRLAWPLLLRNTGGKVVFEAKPIGLYGESGQSAYSSAVCHSLCAGILQS